MRLAAGLIIFVLAGAPALGLGAESVDAAADDGGAMDQPLMMKEAQIAVDQVAQEVRGLVLVPIFKASSTTEPKATLRGGIVVQGSVPGGVLGGSISTTVNLVNQSGTLVQVAAGESVDLAPATFASSITFSALPTKWSRYDLAGIEEPGEREWLTAAKTAGIESCFARCAKKDDDTGNCEAFRTKAERGGILSAAGTPTPDWQEEAIDFSADKLCTEGQAAFVEGAREFAKGPDPKVALAGQNQVLGAPDRYAPFGFGAGVEIGRKELTWLEEDSDFPAYLQEQKDQERFDVKAGASAYHLVRLMSAADSSIGSKSVPTGAAFTIEERFSYSSKWTEQTSKAEYCTDRGEVPQAEPTDADPTPASDTARVCSQRALGAPTRSEGISLGLWLGMADAAKGRLRVSAGSEITLKPQASGPPVVSAELSAHLTLDPTAIGRHWQNRGYGGKGELTSGLVRLSPVMKIQPGEDGPKVTGLLRIELLTERGLFSEEFNEL